MARARQWFVFAAFLCTLYTGSATTPSRRRKVMEIREQLLPLLSKMNGKPKDMHIKAVTVTKVERTHKLPIGADGKPSIAAINELVHAIEKNKNEQSVQPPKSGNTAHLDRSTVSSSNSRPKSMYADLISKMTADVQAALRSSQPLEPSRRRIHSNAERTMPRRERIHPDMHSERRSFRTRSSDFFTDLPHENIGTLSLSRSSSTPRDRRVSPRHSDLGNVERLLDVRDRFGLRSSSFGSDVRDILGSHSSSRPGRESLNYPLEMPPSLGSLVGLEPFGSLPLLDPLPNLAPLTLPSAINPVLGELTRIPNQEIMPNPLGNYRERSTYGRQFGGAQTVSNPGNVQHISIRTDGQSPPSIHTSGSGSVRSLSTNRQPSSYVHTMPHNPMQPSFNPPPPLNSIQSLQIHPMSAQSGQHRQHQSTQSMPNRHIYPQETFPRSQTHPSSSTIDHQRFPQQQLLPVLQPQTHGQHITQPAITQGLQSNSKAAHVSVNVQPSTNPVNLHLAVNPNTASHTQHNRATIPAGNNVFLGKATSMNNGIPQKIELLGQINPQVGSQPQIAPPGTNVIAPPVTNVVAPPIKSIDMRTGTMMAAQNPLQHLSGRSANTPVVIKVEQFHVGNKVIPPVLQALPAPLPVQQSPPASVKSSSQHSKCILFCLK